MEEKDVKNTKSAGKEILEWIVAIAGALMLAILLRTYVFQLIKVDGPSMETTLHNNQKLIVYKLDYMFSKPKQGDIIVFMKEKGPFNIIPYFSEIDYIKRVIAIPGQTVDIKDGKVYIDGLTLAEPYITQETARSGDMQFPLKVEGGTVFVLGDNRNNSKDGRFTDVGLIKYENIRGKAVIRIWPFNEFGYVK